MTPTDFASNFVGLYRNARVLSVPSSAVTRARARSVSSELEELVAAYIASNANRDIHIYVDQPVGIGDGKVTYPDLVVVDQQSKTVIAIVDVKTDIGWKRDGMKAMCEKLARIRYALLNQRSAKLGLEPKLRLPHTVSKNLSCHLVIGASKNSGKELETPDAIEIARSNNVQVFILTEGKHPNDFSRQGGDEFIGMTVRTHDLDALVSGASAV